MRAKAPRPPTTTDAQRLGARNLRADKARLDPCGYRRTAGRQRLERPGLAKGQVPAIRNNPSRAASVAGRRRGSGVKSDWRAPANLRADMRRIERADKPAATSSTRTRSCPTAADYRTNAP